MSDKGELRREELCAEVAPRHIPVPGLYGGAKGNVTMVQCSNNRRQIWTYDVSFSVFVSSVLAKACVKTIFRLTTLEFFSLFHSYFRRMKSYEMLKLDTAYILTAWNQRHCWQLPIAGKMIFILSGYGNTWNQMIAIRYSETMLFKRATAAISQPNGTTWNHSIRAPTCPRKNTCLWFCRNKIVFFKFFSNIDQISRIMIAWIVSKLSIVHLIRDFYTL